MAQISNVRNDGNPVVKTGPKRVNSYNVAPFTVVATPSGSAALSVPADKGGSLISLEDGVNYDFFNVAQTSAATDEIVLSNLHNQGIEFWIYAVSSCKVVPVSGSADSINGGTAGTQGITLTAGDVYIFQKIAAGVWICQQIAPTGAQTAPTPA